MTEHANGVFEPAGSHHMTEKVGRAYVEPETFVRPGPRGRALRLFLGGLQLTATILALFNANMFLRPEEPFSVSLFVVIWLGSSLLVALWLLGMMVNIAFGVTWGDRLYWILLGLAVLTLSLSLAVSGAIWAVPFSLLVFIVILYTTAHLGISLILAAILATPGCEMRSIPHLIAILEKRDLVDERSCPYGLTRFDEREARRRSA